MTTINREITIDKAPWEANYPEKLTNFNYYQFFHDALVIINPPVTDIFDKNRIKIKQDGEKYIFNIDGANKFTVDEADIATFMRQYCKENEKRKAEEDVLVKIEWLKIEYIKSTTQAELDALSGEINKLEKELTLEDAKIILSRNILYFEQQKHDVDEFISANKIDQNLRKAYKSQVQDRLDTLYRLKKAIEVLEQHKDEKYTIKRDTKNGKKIVKEVREVKMDDIYKFDMKETLKSISTSLTAIAGEQKDFIMTRNSIISQKADITPYYSIVINEKKDAKTLKNTLKKYNKQYVILNNLEADAAKKTEVAKDLEALEEYLNTVIANPDTYKPSEHPFVPTHKKEFYSLLKVTPELSEFLQYNKNDVNAADIKNTGTNTWTGTPEKGVWTGTAGTENNKNTKEYTSSTYSDSKEAFEKWGINGLSKYWLDQSNMKPQQKQFWWGVGNLALTGWIIFIGWKMISSAFKLLSEKGRSKENLGKNLGRLLGPTALIFWSQARSGEGPTKLFTWGALTEKISGVFGRGSTTKKGNETQQDRETRLKYKSFPGATALFNGLSYGEMKQFLIQDGDRMKIDPTQYQKLLDMFKTGDKKNEAAATFLDTVGKDDKKNMIDLALTGMGITRENIQDETKADNKFDKSASDAIIRLREVSEYLETNKYNKVNPETMSLVDNYIAGKEGAYTLEELDKRGDVFYKETEVVDQTWLAAKVKELAKDDPEKEEELLLALNTFWENMPNASRKIDITWTWETMTFKTYDQTSTINLKNKELVWFTPSRFTSYYETFKAANLTNRIKFLCKDKEATTKEPFHISTPGGDIEFADPSMFKFDTEIVSAGLWWSLQEISPTLETYKQAYCDYLNTLKFRKQKTA